MKKALNKYELLFYYNNFNSCYNIENKTLAFMKNNKLVMDINQVVLLLSLLSPYKISFFSKKIEHLIKNWLKNKFRLEIIEVDAIYYYNIIIKNILDGNITIDSRGYLSLTKLGYDVIEELIL